MKTIKKQIEIFISHSNAIENEAKTMDSGSDYAFAELITHDKLTPEVIEKAHGFLMNKKDLKPGHKGKFRDCPVWIGGRKCDNQLAIPNQITDFCNAFNFDIKNVDMTLERHLKWHVMFERIHPFIDGNGRLGRLIFLWGLVKTKTPFVYFDEKLRGEYYKIFDGEVNANFLKKFSTPEEEIKLPSL